MRYSTQLDQARLAWLLDAGKRVKLLPAVEARNECDRLNLQIARDQEFGLIGRALDKIIQILERLRR